jgi:hypothetical protein
VSRRLIGREVWRIGDWGGASMHIGRRWEELGAATLERLVDQPSSNQVGFQPWAAVSFVLEPEVERAVQSVGLTNPDGLLVGAQADQLALQPVDFKWSLEVARVNQISAESLQALLAAEVPAIRQAIESKLNGHRSPFSLDGQLAALEQLTLLDGLFVAPDHAANRAFLESQANLRQEVPLPGSRIVFAQVEGAEFFSPLPGWEVGVTLAAQEGARRALDRLEGAEHYYRLGAGVLGALRARRWSIFEPTAPPLEVLPELARLRRDQRLRTIEQLVDHLERVMMARSALLKALSQLGRQVYPFAAFRQTLKSAGIVLPDREEAKEATRRWNPLYGKVQRELVARLREDGRSLVAAGQTDPETLATLTSRSRDLARYAHLTTLGHLRALEPAPPLSTPSSSV